MRFRFWKQILVASSALNTLSEEIRLPELGSANELTYYIVFGPGTSSGAVQIESAHENGYIGTWAPEGPPIAWVSQNRVHKTNIQGISFVSRARISTAIVGGTVIIWAVAQG